MEDRRTLIFDDITDAFGTPKEFTVLNYSIDLEQDVDHQESREDTPLTSEDHQCYIELELQHPEDFDMQLWATQYLSPTAAKRNGNLMVQNQADGSILSELRFEEAECMDLGAGGTHEDGKRRLSKTMRITFAAKALAFNGVTIYGQLQEERRASVPVSVREGDNDTKKVTRYFLTNESGEEIEDYKENDTIIVNIESRNRIGDTVSFSLEDADYDFEYKGEILPDDTLSNIVIGSNLEQITLKVVKPRQARSDENTSKEDTE